MPAVGPPLAHCCPRLPFTPRPAFFQEDKLAGINVLRHCAFTLGHAADWRRQLAMVDQEVYAPGHVTAWSTADALCSRLLAPLLRAQLASASAAGGEEGQGEGESCSRAVLGWCRAEGVWQRRGSVVSFLSLASLPDGQVRGAAEYAESSAGDGAGSNAGSNACAPWLPLVSSHCAAAADVRQARQLAARQGS